MVHDLFLAIVQAATEFLPVSSSGHLALISNLVSKPDIFFFTVLHLASLAAVLVFTRKEIAWLARFDARARRIWGCLAIATVPAVLAGFFFNGVIKQAFFSYRLLGAAFIFTAVVLFSTKFTKQRTHLGYGRALVIGLCQALALFPGVSRSGMTISAALLLGIEREEAAKFSFLLFIPLSAGAFLLESGDGFYFNASLAVAFIVCFLFSLLFLHLLFSLVRKGAFWVFSLYCLCVGIVSFLLGGGT
jgi:undecaprenyl-diphosphatase